MGFFRRFRRPDQSQTSVEVPQDTLNRLPKRRASAKGMDIPRPLLPPELIAVLEQLDETTGQQLLDFLEIERPDLANDLQLEFKTMRGHGPKGLRGAVRRMSLRKASEGLNGRYKMSRLAADGQLVVALPVPPHIEEWVFEEVDPSLIFVAEDHVPPHLEEAELQFLDDLLPLDAQRMFSNVRGILTEGQIRGGAISTRRSVVRLVQLLPVSSLTLFLHHMPHRPPHAEFAIVDKSVEVVEVP